MGSAEVSQHPFAVVKSDGGELTSDGLAAAVESVRSHGAAVVLGAVDLAICDSLREAMLDDLPNASSKPPSLDVPGHVQHTPPLDAAHLHREILANPAALAIAGAILGPLQLGLYTGNTMLPHTTEQQPIHWDEYQLWPSADGPTPPAELTVNIPLVDVEIENGALELWPGTHHDTRAVSHLRSLEVPGGWVDDRRAQVPPVRLPAPKGALIIRDGRVWHRGTTNSTAEPRPMVAVCYYARWYRPYPIDFDADAEPVLRDLGVPVTARYRSSFDHQTWPPSWELVPKPV